MMTPKELKYKTFFMKVALLTSELSAARRSKVGAVLVKDGRILATGFNGTPCNCSNCCEDVLSDGSLVTKPSVVHAEANIIAFAARNGLPTYGTDLFITLSPCFNCALLILQAGIKNVYYFEKYRNTEAITFLQSKNINIQQFSDIDFAKASV